MPTILQGGIYFIENCIDWRSVKTKEIFNVTNMIRASWIQSLFISSNMYRSTKNITKIFDYNQAYRVFNVCHTTTIFANVVRFVTFSALNIHTIFRFKPRSRLDFDLSFDFFHSRRLITRGYKGNGQWSQLIERVINKHQQLLLQVLGQ